MQDKLNQLKNLSMKKGQKSNKYELSETHLKENLNRIFTELTVFKELTEIHEKERRDKEKELIQFMKTHQVDTFESGSFQITYKPPGARMVLDGELLKEEAPEIFLAYATDVPVREKIIVKKKE